MHIPDGLLDPKITTGFAFAAVGVGVFCWNKVKSTLLKKAPKSVLVTNTGTTERISQRNAFIKKEFHRIALFTSLIFVAQMLDFPVTSSTSGHFLGAALASIVFGPFVGLLMMLLILVLQAFLLNDGGLLALGANIFNMGIVASFGAFYLYQLLFKGLKKFINTQNNHLVSAFMVTFISVLVAELFYSLETGEAIASMMKTYLLLGLAEGVITILILKLFVSQKDCFLFSRLYKK